LEGEDAVVDRPSSSGLQDDRSLLPGQVSQVKDGIGETGNLKDVGVASDAVLGCYNAPISVGRDLCVAFLCCCCSRAKFTFSSL